MRSSINSRIIDGSAPNYNQLNHMFRGFLYSATGEQVAQWDFQNNAPAFVLEVPLRNLLTSICNFVPCDAVVQRALAINFTNSTSGLPVVLQSVDVAIVAPFCTTVFLVAGMAQW